MPSDRIPTLSPTRERWLFAAVWGACTLLGYALLGRGWIPHDAGTLGLVAERVLAGELPHRDFVDVYTGGQAFLHAWVFSLFGVSLWSVRLVVFACFAAWIPAVWYLARLGAGPALAALVTLLCAAVSLPVYAEAMPSWYNLFLATWGTAALARWTTHPRPLWLVLAGVAGGLSILAKIVGLYFVAAGLLFLLYMERERSEPGAPAPDLPYRAFAVGACLVLALLALAVVVGAADTVGLLYFAAPPVVAAVYVAERLRAADSRSTARRFATLAALVAPFLAGVALPVAVFLIPYAASGALGALYQGVFVLPTLRLDFAARGALPVLSFLPAVALVLLVARPPDASRPFGRAVALLAAAALVAPIALSHHDVAYRLVWWTLRSLGPVLAVAALWLLPRLPDDTARARAVLLLGVFGFCNLVQLPFAAPIYFLYAFPLLLLLAPAFHGALSPAGRRWLLGATALIAAFALVRLDTGFLYHLGFRYRAHEQTEAFDVERARGLRVSAREKGEYENLVRSVEALGVGDTVLAFPDSPEVYFLTGKRNPTRTLYDFFEANETDPARILDVVDARAIPLVIVNRAPRFSTPPDSTLLVELRRRLDWTRDVGRFRIFWEGPQRGDSVGGPPSAAAPDSARSR